MTNDARADACDTPEYVEISFEQGLPVALDGELTSVPRDHPRDERAGRAPWLRPDRHDREPAGRREEPRDLRGARCAHAHPGAQGARGPVPRARPAALQARHRAEVGGARLQRHVVLAAEGGARRLRGRPPRSSSPATSACGSSRASCVVVGRRSPYSLYDYNLATYDAADTFDHRAAKGFIDLWGLPTRSGRGSAARPARKARSSGRPRPRRAWRRAGTGRRRDRDGEHGRGQEGVGRPVRGLARRVRHRVRRLAAGRPRDVRPPTCAARSRTPACSRRQGIITAEDAAAIEAGLNAVLDEIAAGTFAFSNADEDIHMAVERALRERVGAAGGTLAHGAVAQRPGRDGHAPAREGGSRASSSRARSTLQSALVGPCRRATSVS